MAAVMEFCRGGDLRAKIRQQQISGQLFSEDQILDWFVQLTLALEYLHRRKILHRDVKTENVFLRSSSDFPGGNAATVQLGDFGIARSMDSTHALAQTMVGTPVYMSPELLQGHSYSFKSDMWSLGCILYELLCLRPPFSGASLPELTYHVLFSSYEPPSGEYSKEIRQLLSSLLVEDPAGRPTASSILTLPILRSRAAYFLSICEDSAASCLQAGGSLSDPRQKRCSDISQTAREQARRIGLHLALGPTAKGPSSASGGPLADSPGSPRGLQSEHAGPVFGSFLPMSSPQLQASPKVLQGGLHDSNAAWPLRSSRSPSHPESPSPKLGPKRFEEPSQKGLSPRGVLASERAANGHQWRAHPLPSPPPIAKPMGMRAFPGRIVIEVTRGNVELFSEQGSPIVTLRTSSSDSDMFRLGERKDIPTHWSRQNGRPLPQAHSDSRRHSDSNEEHAWSSHRATKSMDFQASNLHGPGWAAPSLFIRPDVSSPRHQYKMSPRGFPPKSPTSPQSWSFYPGMDSQKVPPSPQRSPKERSTRGKIFSRSRKMDRHQLPSPTRPPTPPLRAAPPVLTSPRTAANQPADSVSPAFARESRRRRWSCPGGTNSSEGMKEVIKEVILEDISLAVEIVGSSGSLGDSRWEFVRSRLGDPARQPGPHTSELNSSAWNV